MKFVRRDSLVQEERTSGSRQLPARQTTIFSLALLSTVSALGCAAIQANTVDGAKARLESINKIKDKGKRVRELLEATKYGENGCYEACRYRKIEAKKMLGNLKDSESIQALVEALEHKDQEIKSAAADAVLKILADNNKEPDVQRMIPAMLHGLKKSNYERVMATFAMLKKVGNDFVPFIKKGMKDPKMKASMEWWYAHITSLYPLQPSEQASVEGKEVQKTEPEPEPKTKLEIAFEGLESKDVKVRRKSLWYLKYVVTYDYKDAKKDPAFINAYNLLIKMMKSDPDMQVRYKAAGLIGRTEDMRYFPVLLGTLEKEDYLGNLKGVDKVKREQTEGLQSSQFAALITIARANKGNPKIQKAIPYVMKELKRLTSGPKVEDGFMSGSLIVAALENIGGPKAVDELVKLARKRVRNISQEARQGAITALAETKDKRAVRAIMGALTDMRVIHCEGGVEWIPATAARLLGEMKARRAVPALIRTLRNKEEDVRVAAAKALGVIGDRRALPALRRVRTHDTYEVREEAKVAIQVIIRGPVTKVGSSN